VNTPPVNGEPLPALDPGLNWAAPDCAELERVLPRFLKRQRWFGSKDRLVLSARIVGQASVQERWWWFRVRVDQESGDYLIALGYDSGELGHRILRESPEAVLGVSPAYSEASAGDGVLFDALWDDAFGRAVLDLAASEKQTGDSAQLRAAECSSGEIQAWRTLTPRRMGLEQSNSAVVYGQRGILKFFRKAQNGGLREAEFLQHLRGIRPLVPACHGALEWAGGVAALFLEFRENQGDAWQRALAGIREMAGDDSCQVLERETGLARLLGRRTGEMHCALAENGAGKFGTEPMETGWRCAAVDAMERASVAVRGRLADWLKTVDFPGGTAVLQGWETLLGRGRELKNRAFDGVRIQVHGDYHLGQVLWTGADFVFIDFEGEPGRPVEERWEKRPALVDVAGMLRSFDYAARVSDDSRGGGPDAARRWRTAVSAAFWEGYWAEVAGTALVPKEEAEARDLLRVFLVEKAVYELGYELMYRPQMASVPLGALRDFLG
jgi:maltose alpha-D-glucosyltransferase/alpha-amylase